VSSTDKEHHPVGHPLSQRIKAKQVGEMLSGVLSEVLAKRSGMTLDLIASWEDIVGPDYADCTLPEKINWPRRVDGGPFSPGSLTVACNGPKALFFQHETVQVLERVNHYFGFVAVDKIRNVQKPVLRKTKRPSTGGSLPEEKRRKLEAVLAQIDDPKLRGRLEVFGKGVYSRKNEDQSG